MRKTTLTEKLGYNVASLGDASFYGFISVFLLFFLTTIVSFQGLVEALAVGIGGQILGVVLERAGFDGTAAVQSENALIWIENGATLIPVVFILVVCVALYKYPITKKTYEEMLEKEERK